MSDMKLFQCGKIGSLKLKNRVIMSPMNVGGNNESDGCLSHRGIDYFVERAKGGVGMVVTGAVRTTRKLERDASTVPLWMLFADHMIHGKWINDLSEKCHDYDTAVCIQLTAGGGRLAGAYAQNHSFAIAPSEVPCFYPPYKNARMMTKEEIKTMVLAFENAARLIKNAGADAIQIHGHQGYLIDQFTTSLWNHRLDEYGGSLENRLRFPKELIEAIKRGAGNDFPVIYRYGLTHYIDGGRTIEEGLEMAKLLESYGVDALDIDSGCYENNYYPHPPTTIPCGSFSYLAEAVKKEVMIPIISSTRIGYPDIAEQIIEARQADFVSLGRPLIADPMWCKKAKDRQLEKIRPCIACHEGCLNRLIHYKRLSCAVNPIAGDEKYLELNKAEIHKNIAIIGGGIAGIVAAITCIERGHSVTLYEQRDELGGNFQLKYIPDFKDDYKRYINYLICRIKRTNVNIILNQKVDADFLRDKFFDKIIVAIGANFRHIEIKGLDTSFLISPFKLYENHLFLERKIIIVGGGLVGVEAAINIARNGGNPIIIEQTSSIASSAYSVNRQHLEVLLKELMIPIYTKAIIQEVCGNTMICKCGEEFVSITFDLVSLCIGMSSNNIGIEHNDNVIVIGDAMIVSNVMNAVWTAYRKCRLI